MTDKIYKDTLETARTEFEKLLAEESRLEYCLLENRKRQTGLKKTVESLSALVGEDTDEKTVGITEAIREVLQKLWERNHELGLTPTGVRLHLHQSGFQLDSYKNPMAVIHTTLKRLEDQDEIKAFPKNEKTLYQWIQQEITDDDIPF